MSKRSRASQPTGPTSPATPTTSRPAQAGGSSASPARRAGTTAAAPRSPWRRYRRAIIGVAIAAVVLVGAAFLFVGAAQPAYACESSLAPVAAASPAPGSTPRLGQVTRDLGRAHVDTGQRVSYEFCPPTSGGHYSDPQLGPIATRFDQLPTPYAAVVWGRIYFLDSLDVPAITTFQQQSADRGPEAQCQAPAPGASPSAAPSGSAAP